VASPTQEDMHQVFTVRRALERAIAAELAERCGGQPIALLRSHLDSEAHARATGDRAALAHLTGDFHVRLAETTGNRIFTDNLRRLVALTGLVIAQYDVHASSACPEHEHADIVKAIESGDARRAERLMLEHLKHVEEGIQSPGSASREVNFEKIFGLDEAATPQKRRRGG